MANRNQQGLTLPLTAPADNTLSSSTATASTPPPASPPRINPIVPTAPLPDGPSDSSAPTVASPQSLQTSDQPIIEGGAEVCGTIWSQPFARTGHQPSITEETTAGASTSNASSRKTPPYGTHRYEQWRVAEWIYTHSHCLEEDDIKVLDAIITRAAPDGLCTSCHIVVPEGPGEVTYYPRSPSPHQPFPQE